MALGLPSGDFYVVFRQRDAAHEAVVLGRCLDPENLIFPDYRRISKPGTVYVVNRKSSEPHLVVCITPLLGMGVKDKQDLNPWFPIATFKYYITRNGAMVDSKMFGLG